ncbi:MAG: pilus assembly FimT family protein [Marinobacter sp.]|uniref:pilus assembly FimT family protein n=1 Tax=Marinobacter sp. TaxID=50741 RepID=UPI003F949AAF
MRRQSGMTLVELLITLVILGIAVGIAIPSFREMILNNRVTGQVNTVSGMIGYARSSASSRPGVSVTLCSSSDGATCSGSEQWESGWIVFTDVDGDTSFDTGDDEILKVNSGLSGGNTLRVRGFGANSAVRFDAEGMPRLPAGAPAAGTFIVCDERGVGAASAVVVSGAGQVRIVRDGNDHAENAIGCP